METFLAMLNTDVNTWQGLISSFLLYA